MASNGNNPIGEGVAKRENDQLIPDGIGVIEAINQYRQESADARRDRDWKGDRNWDMYLGKQDWSHKQPGQSQEFLPKVPVSVEQLAALVKRALVQFGKYFSVDVDAELGKLITGNQVRDIIEVFTNDLWLPNGQTNDFVR